MHVEKLESSSAFNSQVPHSGNGVQCPRSQYVVKDLVLGQLEIQQAVNSHTRANSYVASKLEWRMINAGLTTGFYPPLVE